MNSLGLKIKGFEDYVVTSDGDVYSYKRLKPRKLKPQKVSQSKKKYLQVRLFNKDTRRGKTLPSGMIKQMGKLHYIHRLVWESFVGEIPEGKEIDHKDGNPHNNNIKNLQVITRRENLIKYSAPDGKMYIRFHRDEVIEDFKKLKSMPKVAQKWGVSTHVIRRCIKNIYYKKIKVNGKQKYITQIWDENIKDKWVTQDLRNKGKKNEIWL